MISRIAATAAVVMMLAATSAAAAPRLKDEDVAKLQVGVTTYAEVISRFGRPMESEVSSDGSRLLVYTVTHSRIKAVTFVPWVGLIAGGTKADVNTQRLQFGADGKLASVLSSATHVDCGLWGGCGGGAGKPLSAPMAPPAVAPTPAAAPAPPAAVVTPVASLPPPAASTLAPGAPVTGPAP